MNEYECEKLYIKNLISSVESTYFKKKIQAKLLKHLLYLLLYVFLV